MVAHVGLHALGAFADRIGLGDALSSRIPPAGERFPLHDRGKVLVQTSLMLAGGGESCADIEHLRLQEDLFGSVPSDTTVFRTFYEITAETRSEIACAMAEVRTEVWRRSAATTGSDPVLLDIDASLVEIHSEHKVSAAPTFKGGYGFHPMFCFADATGETLAAVLRPGNAGANTVADHVGVLDDAVVQLPGEIALGHRRGDDPALVEREVVVRADSAGLSGSPHLFTRPPVGPPRLDKAVLRRCVSRGPKLNQVEDLEAVLPQQPDPVAVAQVKLNGWVIGPLETVHFKVGAAELCRRRFVVFVGNTEHQQCAVPEEEEFTSGPEEARRLGYPGIGISPDGGAVLADHEIERIVPQGDVFARSPHQRK